ncbi:hypothetical protein BGX27_008637 [Mortierella sp. AM989]|nr:hypothetical protein BGX27_008637 [Mortierella sp. AM989]
MNPTPVVESPAQAQTDAPISPHLPNRLSQGASASALLQPPISGMPTYPSPSILPTFPTGSSIREQQHMLQNEQVVTSPNSAIEPPEMAVSSNPEPTLHTASNSNSTLRSQSEQSGPPFSTPEDHTSLSNPDNIPNDSFRLNGVSTTLRAHPPSTLSTILPSLSVPLGPLNMATLVTGQPSVSSSILSSLPSSLPIRSDKDHGSHRSGTSISSSCYGRSNSFHMHSPSMQPQQDPAHDNPYKAPSYTNSWAFVPPKIPGYDFRAGSQAGNLGLMIGKRISDGMPVTGTLHLSRVLLQHEHRILKRLQIVDSGYDSSIVSDNSSVNSNKEVSNSSDAGTTGSETAEASSVIAENAKENLQSSHQSTGEEMPTVTPSGLVEGEKYFNRIVEDFMDLDQAELSILIMRRLGPNLLSPQHHRFVGLDETDGHQGQDSPTEMPARSPFSDVYIFLVFCLKAACVLEALQRANLAHLALCPTAFHWAPPNTDVVGPNMSSIRRDQDKAAKGRQLNPPSLYHDDTPQKPDQPMEPTHRSYSFSSVLSKEDGNSHELSWDVNKTKLRLFDFAHSRILSHERARAPNNIAEWHIPGYLEYHLQFLAPEQTGRAETWMDHRTDIYGLGATLFSLLTMQFPNRGSDSVQILQGVLSRDLPPLSMFRPDMPPIIDDIIRKMTQKQPSHRYQNAFGFKQDILRCLNELQRTGMIGSFPLGKHDISYQFVIPSTVFGRNAEQQLISSAIAQAAIAYKNSFNNDVSKVYTEEGDVVTTKVAAMNDSDHYVFEDDIVPLQNQACTKIPLSSKTLLGTPKPFDGGKSVHRGSETTDPAVRAIFVSGPSGVGKTALIRGISTVARNSGLFAGGVFEAEGSEPYSAIIFCVKSVLQQLLAQKPEPLASLIVAITTAFDPNSGIGIVCDLIPELIYFFKGSELSKSEVPLTHSMAQFHALILKLIRVISTHFFMTWLIDDIQHADEDSITLLAMLVNVNKRLPMVLIITHNDTVDCLVKVKQILGGSDVSDNNHKESHGSSGDVHQTTLVDEMIHSDPLSSGSIPTTKTTANRASELPLMVRGGGGVRFIRLHNPSMDNIQEFLSVLLHRTKMDVLSLASVLHGKSWLTIRQLVLELYRNGTINFNRVARIWDWESCPDTLAELVRKLTGEEYSFLRKRFKSLDCYTKKTLICAAICGSIFTIHNLQHLASTAFMWTKTECQRVHAPETALPDANKGSSAMAGLQSALKEGILIYTSAPDHLRWHHNVMRKVSIELIEGTDVKERLHYEMAKILFRVPGQEFKTANHVLQCLNLVKKKISCMKEGQAEEKPYWNPIRDEDTEGQFAELDAQSLRSILSLAGEKSQKSGSQDMAMTYWNAALSLLPDDCWNRSFESRNNNGSNDVQMLDEEDSLYQETLKLHLQCIRAERWRENFDQAMKICDTILANTTDPIDRARVYQHQIQMSVWAYSQPPQAARIAIQCLQELGMPKDISFSPTQEEIKKMYDQTHLMVMRHMDELQAENPRMCEDPRIDMMMEVLSLSISTLYYNDRPFLAVGIAQSVKLVCESGISKQAGRALVNFALTHTTWHGCLENAYELGVLACKLSKNDHHVEFIFMVSVQQWGDHVANSLPALEETLQEADLVFDRLFHTAGTIHVSVVQVLLGRIHLRDCMKSTRDLVTKHIEFGPKSHGVEVIHGNLQMIKALMGQTLSDNPETIFDDNEFAESKLFDNRSKMLVMVHNNTTYSMLKVMTAFVYCHYAYINEVTSSWHDDPTSIMNLEGTWILHSTFTVVGLSLVTLLRTEQDPETRQKLQDHLFSVRDKMAIRAAKYPTNHAAMFHLLEAEILDQALEDEASDLKTVLLTYEKAIEYAIKGNFPLHKCFSYEFAAKCHLRHGLVTSAKCLMIDACKAYQEWGARGKASWFNKTYPDMFASMPDLETTSSARGLFYRPSDPTANPLTTSAPAGSTGSNAFVGTAGSSGTGSSPWLTGSPKLMYSPSGYGHDAVSAAATAIAESCMATNIQSGGVSSASSSTGPLSNIQNSWLASPQSPEIDNSDLDVLDFSSVIEAMQVIASEIDLDLLLVNSLGVLNQCVGARRCCLIIISKEQEPILAASQEDSGQCESVIPPLEVSKCNSLFHGVINYVINTSTLCLVTNAKDDPRFCADEYLKQKTDLKTVLCAPILHKTAMVGVLYMEDFPERAFANKRMLVMNLLVQQLGISITNALLYQSVLESETRLKGLLENMPCGIGLWDANARVCQYINSGWTDMTGFTSDEIKDSGWQVLTHKDELDIYAQHWRECVKAGVPKQWESRYMRKDGSFRWGIVRMLPFMPPPENKIIRWITVTIDIDDQRRAVQLKSNFLANMSHELRTPFSGILGMLSLLRDSSGLSNEQFEFVDMAKGSCEMLIRIVDDLLNFSKLEADKVTLEYIPLCFEEIIGDVCDLLVPLASRKGLELIILFDETAPVLLIGDPDRMKQILMNLIGNAIKFSTAGNVVIEFWHELNKREDIIRSRNEESSQNMLKTFYHGKSKPKMLGLEIDDLRLGDEVILHCTVKDQGIGMSQEEQKMLFVSFQQTDNGTTRKYGGTGLGLSICRQLIAHMGGEITVDSVKGKGSTFTFTAKLRTETTYDVEQNPCESSRIKECIKIKDARLDVIQGKRVLVLSPNRQLRLQIVKILCGTICSEFDDLASALASGVVMMTGESITANQADGMELDDNHVNSQDKDISLQPSSNTFPYDSPAPFDFILVDHVLDSVELDQIYPSPSIAFVLLLAPTTETLRWILPPANRLKHDPEEHESDQFDIGGRGRVRHSQDEGGIAEKVATGCIQRASHGSTSQRVDSSSSSESCKVINLPSQLFKKRKSRGFITVTRPVPRIIGEQHGEERTILETSTFQVCRMIKPVRRMKLLQIFYNAVNMHNNQGHTPVSGWESLSSTYDGLSEHGEQDRHSNISGCCDDEPTEKQLRVSKTEPSSPTSPSPFDIMSSLSSPSILPRSRSTSPVSTSSLPGHPLKRRRDHGTPDLTHISNDGSSSSSTSDGELNRRPKALKQSSVGVSVTAINTELAPTTVAIASPSPYPSLPLSILLDPMVDTDVPRNLGLSGAALKIESSLTRDRDTNLPKRMRNNDALTSLLSAVELESCRGKNVLVAEDDFVSQKILEKQLTKLGMNVMITNNGQEAVNQWLSVDRGHYTIAIFDHHMPIMDGLAATKALRALEAEFKQNKKEDEKSIRIPIVGLSADIQQSTKEVKPQLPL